MQKPQSNRGAVLIISLCILFLLSLFALTFTKLVNFERQASTNYMDSVRARLLARAGISRAVVELRALAGRRHYSDPRLDKWEYGLKLPGSMSESERTQLDLKLDLLTTTEPSFVLDELSLLKAADGDPDPQMFQAPLAVSGLLGRTYDNGLDVYKLKVIDAASQLNLNHPDPDTIERMLTNLLRSSAEEDPTVPSWNLPKNVAEGIAANVINHRPKSGFNSKSEVKALIMISSGISGLNRSNYVSPTRWNLLLRDKLTVLSWVDEKVIRPWNLNEKSLQGLPLMPRAPININTASKPVLVALLAGIESRNDYGTFKLGYDGAKQVADRIIAWRTVTQTNLKFPFPFKGKKPKPVYEYAGTSKNSEFEYAAGVKLRKGPFRSWADFEAFVDHRLNITGYATVLAPPKGADPYIKATGTGNYQAVKVYKSPPGGTSGSWPEGLVPRASYKAYSPTWKALEWGQGIRDLIKAQLNPNTMLNKFGSSHGGRQQNGVQFPRFVDKSDLVTMTTEGCFDSMGVYEITSVGLVLIRDAQAAEFYSKFLKTTLKPGEMTVVASQTQQVVIRVYDVLRYTNQADFEKYRASMIPGEFIPDIQKWRTQTVLLGVNRHDDDIMATDIIDDAEDPVTKKMDAGVPSWPGLISHPTYSMVRRGDSLREIGPNYVPALYDGHLTLTNLLGVTAKPHDFIAGFARGTTSAFKVRVWWDPKDQRPYSDTTFPAGLPFSRNGGSPSHPAGLNPPPGKIPDGVESEWWDRWYAGEVKIDGKGVDYTELDRLAQPMTPTPRKQGVLSGERGVLDTSMTTSPTDGQWWHEGSSLWNNGVVVSPLRKTAGGATPVLVYDGDNIDLERASSIRFWTQPLVDPYLRETEVLLSFIGSRKKRGEKREIGFKVFKEISPDGAVVITLQVAPSFDYPELDPGGLKAAKKDYYKWHILDDTNGIWESSVQIDVKPDVAGRCGTRTFPTGTAGWGNQDANPNGPNVIELNPLEPEWFANTWHWIVLNYGYARIDGGPGGFAQFDLSLQVDMKPPQPPWSLDVDDPGRIIFAGDTTVKGGNDFWGELHGHEHAATDERPGDGSAGSMTANTGADPRVMEALGADREKHEGDCPCPSGQKYAGTTPGLTRKHIDTADHGRIASTHTWLEPRVLGDFYNCRDGAKAKNLPDSELYPGAITYTPPTGTPGDDDYVPGVFTNTVDIKFPSDAHKFGAEIRIKHADGTITRKMTYDPGATGAWGGWTVSVPNDADMAALTGPVTIDLYVSWERSVPGDTCPNCNDGEALYQWNTDPAQFPTWTKLGDATLKRNAITEPNGTTSCVNMMQIHGRPAVTCGTGSFPLPCWTVSSGEMGAVYWTWITSAPDSQLKAPSKHAPYSDGYPARIPVDLMCDGCRGCENCDVDGPLFLGGEPGGGLNYSGGNLVNPKKSTVAFAVFDNLVIKNRYEDEVRTDFAVPAGQTPVDWYEDRYFETNQAKGHFDLNPNTAGNQDGYGAIYRRGLLELYGHRARLGSMTWTSYKTTSGKLQFEVKLYNVPGEDATGQTWRKDKSDLLTQTGAYGNSRLLKRSGKYGAGPTTFSDGLAFGDLGPDASFYDGIGGGSSKPQILVMSIQLGELYSVNATTGEDEGNVSGKQTVSVDSSDGSVSFGTGLPTPIVETPAFEDVTLSLIRETAQILYSEEGIACN